MVKKNKAKAFAAAYAASEAHVRAKTEKRSAELRNKANEVYADILERYREASDTRVREQCERRYARLLTDLAEQDKIIAECYETLESLSRKLERVLETAVLEIATAIEEANLVAGDAQVAIDKANKEEEEVLAAFGVKSAAM